jgi:hypothetical protein
MGILKTQKKINFDMKLTKEQILGIVRHSLTFIGGIFVMKGLIHESMIEVVVASSITLAGTIWSIIDKK